MEATICGQLFSVHSIVSDSSQINQTELFGQTVTLIYIFFKYYYCLSCKSLQIRHSAVTCTVLCLVFTGIGLLIGLMQVNFKFNVKYLYKIKIRNNVGYCNKYLDISVKSVTVNYVLVNCRIYIMLLYSILPD